jgi:hypothetical protein
MWGKLSTLLFLIFLICKMGVLWLPELHFIIIIIMAVMGFELWPFYLLGECFTI